jgi:type VI protein secretion system component VasA
MNKLLKSFLGHVAPHLHLTTPASATVTLGEHEWRSTQYPAGVLIDNCLRGHAVITQQGASRDQVLAAGESHWVTRSARRYAQAQCEAELSYAMTMAAARML